MIQWFSTIRSRDFLWRHPFCYDGIKIKKNNSDKTLKTIKIIIVLKSE